MDLELKYPTLEEIEKDVNKIPTLKRRTSTKIVTRSDMFVTAVYNVFCTPVTIALLYCASVTNLIGWFTAQDDLLMLIVTHIAIFTASTTCSKVLIWADLNCLINLGLPVTKEENFVHMLLFAIGIPYLVTDPVIYVPPNQPRIDVPTFLRYNKFLLIIAYASVPMNIMLCMGIYYSTFFQHILSNMYNYYGVICTVYIIIYVFILNYWIRNWSRDLLKARLDPKELRRLKDQIY